MAVTTDELEAVVAAARRVERETGVGARALLAVALVESAGVAFAAFDNRREPLIRFEGHCFDRLLPEAKRPGARKAGLASPKAGAVRNPAAQSARWRLLERAVAIDAAAAHAATSWGLGQVMGAHGKRLGYAGPEALAADARGSIDGQLRIVAAFLKLGGLARHIETGAFADFARAYNGPAYRRNAYDVKIEKASIRAAKLLAAAPGAQRNLPRRFLGREVPRASAGAGWSRLRPSLSRLVPWLPFQRSIRAVMRCFSTSTARSPSFATIPPPCQSNGANSTS